MIIKTLIVGPLETNCYIISDSETKDAIVIDPGDEPDRIKDILDTGRLNVKYLVCTHAHVDHLGAIPELKDFTSAQIVIHREELQTYQVASDMGAIWGYDISPLPPPNIFVSDEDEIKVGNITFKVFHTPGHSPGGICLYNDEIVITGDTLFAGSVGRTDLPGGDMNKLKASFKYLMTLPESTEVLPGHGPSTTIRREKRENFFAYEIE